MPAEPLPPIEAWNALVDFVEDADMAVIEAMSEEELDAELLAAGLGTTDPKVRQYGPGYPLDDVDEVPAALQSGPSLAEGGAVSALPADVYEPERVVDIGRRAKRGEERSWSVLLFAAAILATLALGGGAVIALRESPAPPGPDRTLVVPRAPEVPERAPEEVLAVELRRDALDACSEHAWSRCLAMLDRAKQLDPAGEGATAALRARALDGLKAVGEVDAAKGRDEKGLK